MQKLIKRLVSANGDTPSILAPSISAKYNASNTKTQLQSTKQLKVSQFEREQLLKRYLKFHLDYPISLVEKLLRQKKIWVLRTEEAYTSTTSSVQRKFVNLSSNFILKANDTVCINYKDNPGISRPSLDTILQQPLPPMTADQTQLDSTMEQLRGTILYHDADIIVLNKSPGISVHSGSKNQKVHLQRLFRLLRHVDPHENSDAYQHDPQAVHRLDKPVGGCLVLGRNQYSIRMLNQAFRESSDPSLFHNTVEESVDAFGNSVQPSSEYPSTRLGQLSVDNDDDQNHNADLNEQTPVMSTSMELQKVYWAILTGVPPKPRGVIDNYLFIPPEAGIDISSDDDFDSAVDVPTQYGVTVVDPSRIHRAYQRCLKRAVTRYEVIHEIGTKGCLVRLTPLTGRKHQLRVHCAITLNSPILGDAKYGIKSYRKLHDIGWGQLLDFTRYSGLKGQMPMFLHMRQLNIENYFQHLGHGAKGVENEVQARSIGGSCYQSPMNLSVTSGLNDLWKQLLRACHFDFSTKV
ncbi:hypothetical protein MP228_008594 [Amoeboaphelidium protococcarum]|nr:hypothetical protein MP228_008594 [Amoeboaphelidium protococcarum]